MDQLIRDLLTAARTHLSAATDSTEPVTVADRALEAATCAAQAFAHVRGLKGRVPVWEALTTLPGRVPEWAPWFANQNAKPRGSFSEREARDLRADAEAFLHLVESHLGIPFRHCEVCRPLKEVG